MNDRLKMKLVVEIYQTSVQVNGWENLLHTLSHSNTTCLSNLPLLNTHIQQAKTIIKNARLSDISSNTLKHIADSLPMPIVLCDTRGHVLQQNSLGEVFLNQHRDWLKAYPQAPLSISPTIWQHIADACKDQLPHIVNLGPPEGQKVTLWAVPSKNAQGDQISLIPSTDWRPQPLPTPKNTDALKNAYHLTSTEARLALFLTQGLSLAESARKSNLTYESSRSALKTIFQKVGCKKQHQLVIHCLELLWASPLESTQQPPPEKSHFKQTILVENNRKVAIESLGNPDGIAVFFYKSMLGTAFREFSHQKIADLGLRILIIDRPGLGDTSPSQHDTYIQRSNDIILVADQLGIGRFHLAAYGLGSPFALALAYKQPSRVISLTLISPPASYPHWKKLSNNRFLSSILKIMETSPPIASLLLQSIIYSAIKGSSSYLRRVTKHGFSKRDYDTLNSSSIQTHSLNDLEYISSQGSSYIESELKLLLKPWGFQLEDIFPPSTIWHGANDRVIPASHAHFLNSVLPNNNLELLEDEGHLMICHLWPKILKSIATS